MIGKSIRMRRIFSPDHKSVIVPMDHGFTYGQMYGLLDIDSTIHAVTLGGARAVVLHIGMARRFAYVTDAIPTPPPALIIHLNGCTMHAPDQDAKVMVCSVIDAVRAGADAVSMQINLGTDMECEMIAQAGVVSSECQRYGIPLLLMVYSRGRIKPEDGMHHCVRIAEELGADFVKIEYCKDRFAFLHVIQSSSIPVLIAGGAHEGEDDNLILSHISDAMSAGAAGVCAGRIVFQRETEAEVTEFTRKVCSLVF